MIMKEFFKRQGVKLIPNDIHRFLSVLTTDLGAVLEGYELVVHILDEPDRKDKLSDDLKKALSTNRPWVDPGSKKIYLPVALDGQPLAVIAAAPPKGRPVAEAVHSLLPTILRLSLEKILLYKISVTDRETGLYNEYYFRSWLRKSLNPQEKSAGASGLLTPLSLSDQEVLPTLSVVLAQVDNFDNLAAEQGRPEALKALKALAKRMQAAASGPYCLARLNRRRLGMVLLKENLEAAAEFLDRLKETPDPAGEEPAPPIKPAFGLVGFPQDLADEPGVDDPAELLLARAELALNQALLEKGASTFTYAEMLQKGGRVVQVLPFNRVVVNLGRVSGARDGQVFILREADQKGEVDYKGEVVLFDVQQDFSLGEVINLRSSLVQVRPGDPLVFSRTSVDKETDRQGEDSLDALLGIPDHHGFGARLSKRLAENLDSDKKFALVLARVDGYDRYRATMGHLESDRQFKVLYEFLLSKMPEAELMGRFSSDCLALFLPGTSEAEAVARAEALRDEIRGRHRQTVSFGAAVYPCGPYAKQEITSNAQKALEHAGFLGPASVAAFDSVSLNISGDKRFEARDYPGAIDEYRIALQLNPKDLNVLNSLGVCYGCQGKTPEALASFDQALELDPENLMAHYNRGFILAMDGQTTGALDNFRRAAAIDPGNFDVLFQIGKLALELDLVDEALGSLKKAAQTQDPKPIVFRYLGQTQLKVGRPEEAVDAFKAAVRYDPEDAASLSQLGVLYHEQEADLDVALSLLRQSVDLDPTNSLFHQRLARTLAAAGRLEEAEAEFRRAMELGGRSREIHYELGLTVLNQGRPDEAAACFKESLAADPNFGPAAEALAALEG